ncbi:hypothetical protein WJX75_000676 [Coccomyxa subellipsoidea]|uniref:RHOMBOID-like protein n=1 Tax=Coccomyxa subellipsoidea TaxID=248742 RepID=A0ABR2YBV0_9CHLO
MHHRETGKAVDVSRSPHKLRTEEVLVRRPAFSSLSEYSSNKAVPPGREQHIKEMGLRRSREGRLRGKDLQENISPVQVSPMERSSAGKARQPADVGWRYNQSFVKERQASWQRPSIRIPGQTMVDVAAGASARTVVSGKSPENTDRSLPWPAISPKEAAKIEQEAWYLEQVAEVLAGDPLQLAAFKEILKRCKARSISAAAAHQQVAVILAGHPALIEGFAALVPGMEHRIWPDVQPAEEPAMPEERREEEQALDNGRAKLLPGPPAATPQSSQQSAGGSSTATGHANQGWRSFSHEYLVSWGVRHLPLVAAGQWWLWATGAFVHTNFMHLAGNLIPWAAVAFLLETRFGSIRIAPLFLASLLGAAFASAALDPSCGLVAGSNGLMAGMLPLLCASFVADWKTMAFPFLQLLLCISAVGLHVTVAIMQAREPWQSHWAELGAFVCGLLPSILFTPGPADKRWRPAARLAVRCGLAVTSARTRGQKRRRAQTASPLNGDFGAASEERPLRSTGSAPRLAPRDEAPNADVASGDDVPMESPMPARPTKRRLTAPRPDAAAHVNIEAPEEERALRERWAPNSPGLRAAAEWREQLDGSFRRADLQLPYLRKEAARPGQEPDAIAAHRADSPHGAVELALLNPDEDVRSMEEGRSGVSLRRHATKQALHRQQASNESIASSLTSAGTADARNDATVEDAEPAGDGSPGPRAAAGKRRLCSSCSLLWMAFCTVSTLLFLGTLVGLPVYLYLVRLPSLACPP